MIVEAPSQQVKVNTLGRIWRESDLASLLVVYPSADGSFLWALDGVGVPEVTCMQTETNTYSPYTPVSP